MPETFETYRGAVAPSECDAFGHLNIAFYPDRFEAAAMDLLERLGAAGDWRTVALDTRYLGELRAGEGIVIRSFVLASERGSVYVAHEGMTPSGERTTLAEHRLAADEGVVLPPSSQPWERFPPLDLGASDGALAAGRDRIGRGEAAAGGLAISAYVRRFSDACLFAIDAIGMTPSYRADANRGFATFETRLSLEYPPPRAGDGVAVTSGVIAVGTSSLRLAHTMRATRDGRLLARFHQAGVHFDLERRRGAPWPPEFRAKALSLRIAAA